MKKGLSILNITALGIGVILYVSFTFLFDIDFGTGYKELENIILLALPCVMVFCCSFLTEDIGKRKKCLLFYLLCFIFVLFGFVLSSSRSNSLVNQGILSKEHNWIPFQSIHQLWTSELGLKFALYNILGNLWMLSPLSILLPLLFEKQKHILPFLLTIVLICLGIEVVQYVTTLGSLDIDDFLLNVIGALVVYILIQKTKLSGIVENLFLKYHIPDRLCITIYGITFFLFILLSIQRISIIFSNHQQRQISFENVQCLSSDRIYLTDIKNYHYYSSCDYGDSVITVGKQRYTIGQFLKSVYFNEKYMGKLNLEKEEIITNALLKEKTDTKLSLYRDEFSTVYLYGYQEFYVVKDYTMHNVKEELTAGTLSIEFLHNLVESSYIGSNYGIETGKYYSILTCGETYSTYREFYVLDTKYKINKNTCQQLMNVKVKDS